MFWYLILIDGDGSSMDDWRMTDDRGAAIVAMIVCHLRVRVVCK